MVVDKQIYFGNHYHQKHSYQENNLYQNFVMFLLFSHFFNQVVNQYHDLILLLNSPALYFHNIVSENLLNFKVLIYLSWLDIFLSTFIILVLKTVVVTKTLTSEVLFSTSLVFLFSVFECQYYIVLFGLNSYVVSGILFSKSSTFQ